MQRQVNSLWPWGYGDLFACTSGETTLSWMLQAFIYDLSILVQAMTGSKGFTLHGFIKRTKRMEQVFLEENLDIHNSN